MTENITVGILTGLITYLIIRFCEETAKRWEQRRFKRIFGHDAFTQDGMAIYYAQFVHLPIRGPDGKPATHFFVKPVAGPQKMAFSISRPVSICEVRAARYLGEAFVAFSRRNPRLVSDIEEQEKLDVSFVSLGGPLSNFKTGDVISNESNRFVKFDNETFRSPQSDRAMNRQEVGFDYGLILKIRPKQFPQRVWIACCGLGEWGTSGSTWYLANKWRELERRFGDGEFAVLLKVRGGQDESADAVVFSTSGDDSEEYAKGIS